MVRYLIAALLAVFASPVAADDRVHFSEEVERRWNTPPELTPESASAKSENSPQPRFLPFSASFTLSAGAGSAHSLSIGGNNDGISLSQSQSSSSGAFGNTNGGISTSQSSSFTAGPSGISAADANAFNLNHPVFGEHSQADSNSFALGQADASAHGGVVNNQVNTGAQSGVGNGNSAAASGASSNVGNTGGGSSTAVGNWNQSSRRGKPSWTNIAPNYEIGGVYNPSTGQPLNPVRPHRRPLRLKVEIDDSRFNSKQPEVLITDWEPPRRSYRPFRALQPLRAPIGDQWSQDHLVGPSPQMWSQSTEPKPLQVSAVSASSAASSTSPNGFSLSQSSTHSQTGPSGPSSWSTNYAESGGNAESHAQGAAAAVGHHSGNTQGSFSSGAISASSVGNGHSKGTSASGNRGQNSRGQVNSQSLGTASAQGTANAGSVSLVRFPDGGDYQNIPREFVRGRPLDSRSSQRQKIRMNRRNPVDDFFTDITDTVVDLFDFS